MNRFLTWLRWIAIAGAVAEDFAKARDLILVVAGIPFGQAGTTNNLRVAQIDDR